MITQQVQVWTAQWYTGLTLWLLDEGGDDVGEGGGETHRDTPVKGDGHDAVHDEDDEDEVPAQQERVIDQVIGLHKPPDFVISHNYF